MVGLLIWRSPDYHDIRMEFRHSPCGISGLGDRHDSACLYIFRQSTGGVAYSVSHVLSLIHIWAAERVALISVG